jgi:ribonuclease HII
MLIILSFFCLLCESLRVFVVNFPSLLRSFVFGAQQRSPDCPWAMRAMPFRIMTALCYSPVMPHFELERRAGGRVVGVDEVGRGPLAGPVVAAAVVFPNGVPAWLAPLLDDSKKLDAAQRLAAYQALRESGAADIALGAASVSEIAQINILRASLLAMRRAVARLSIQPDAALVDGLKAPDLPCAVQCVVGGDSVSLSIAAASIVAKVVRDSGMARLAKRCPGYGWEKNAGYGTQYHRDALTRLGPTEHHRASFGTVRLILAARQNTVSMA